MLGRHFLLNMAYMMWNICIQIFISKESVQHMIIVTIQNLRIGAEANSTYLVLLLNVNHLKRPLCCLQIRKRQTEISQCTWSETSLYSYLQILRIFGINGISSISALLFIFSFTFLYFLLSCLILAYLSHFTFSLRDDTKWPVRVDMSLKKDLNKEKNVVK